MMTARTKAIVFFALLFASTGAHAQLACTISATSLDFGLYSPLDATPLNSTSRVRAVCQGGFGFLRFRLSPGNSGDATNRVMLSGANPLSYNIYRNTSRTQVWGDGSGGTFEVYRLQWSRRRIVHNVTAYGSIPAGQNGAAGFYTDDIVVTVIF